MKRKNNLKQKHFNLKKMSDISNIGWNEVWLSEEIEEEIFNGILPCGM